MRRSALTLGAALLCAFPATARADDGDIIVQREPGLSGHERAELRHDAGVELVSTLPIARTELVKPEDGDVSDAVAALRQDDEVVAAEPDTRVRLTASAPNDFFWTSLWALSNVADTDIDAPEAWERGARGDGVTVAVVDTGINASHVDLASQIDGGWDFVDNDDTPQDGNGHGSHVAGTIAAAGNNGAGLIGVAPDARVMPLRVMDDDGSGWMSNIAAGFAYAADHGAPIVSASLGGARSSVLEDVIAAHPQTLFVVAAGNDNVDDDDPDAAEYPCAFPEDNVVCVGASDMTDSRASFSNYGATSVDLFAPGVGILSAWKGASNAYRLLNGTSMATPHVAGAAALALSANPAANSAQLKWALLSSADEKPALDGKSVTGGRLNADGAVAAVTGTMPELSVATPVPTATPTPEATPVATATPEPPVVTTPPPPPVAAPAPVTPATPAPAAVVVVAPALTHLKIAGLRVTFTLNRSTSVRFAISRRGHRVTTFTRQAHAGANTVLLPRRNLKRGAYTLAVGLSANASSARAIRVR